MGVEGVRSTQQFAPLVGRGPEFGRLRDLLAAAQGSHGSSVLLRGEPGVGKSALIAQLIEDAQDFTVLRCRGVETEAELPFAALHELLLPLKGQFASLPEEERDALTAALSMVSEPASVVHASMAALTLIANAAAAAPVLVIADDIHWMDESSLLVLTFVARRITYDRVLLVAAERPGRDAAAPLGEVVELSPLSAAAVQQLAGQLTDAPVPGETAHAIAEATGGNPLAVIETMRLLGANLDRIGTALDEPLPPGELIERGFASRLADLPPETREALTVAATAFTESAEIVTRAVAHLRLPADALDAAERAGIMVRQFDSLRFSHPLLRALVFHGAAPDDRRRFHAALAAVASDPGVKAWHAASACVAADGDVADQLAAAAAGFQTRGGVVASAQALERAARLTPDRLMRARRLLAAAYAARRAGRGGWAGSLLEEALDLTGRDRSLELTVEIELEQIALDAHTGATQDLLAHERSLADAAQGMHPTIACDALTNVGYEGVVQRDAATALEAIREADRLAPQAAASVQDDTNALVGITLLATGDDPQRGVARLRETARDMISGRAAGYPHAVVLIAEYLWPFGEEPLARELLARVIPATRKSGDLITLAGALGISGGLQTRSGEWASAETLFDQAIQLAGIRDLTWYTTSLEVRLANLKALRGDPSTLVVPERLKEASGPDLIPFHDQLGTAHGLYALGAGDGPTAVRVLQEVADVFERGAMNGPTILPWPAEIVEAYALVGDRSQAQRYLAAFRQRWAALPTPWSLGIAARLEGLLADDADFEDAFTEAFAHFADTTAPFDLARTHLQFGRRLRRAGKRTRATEHLTAARQAFDRLGAPQWAAQARTELAAAGAVRTTGDGQSGPVLTSQERVVADCVARGMTNKEAAAQLFITPKTIEWHLRQIYRKLEITSRVQLASYIHGLERPAAETVDAA